MDELLKEMERFQDLTSTFTLMDVAWVLVLSFFLSAAVATTYRATHRGVSYSQSYTQTLVVLGMIVGMIMLIIGSNLARAFSLVGALSIVRFRNAVKETRDVGFVFLVMSIGMACGTRFYALATFATAVICGVIILMFRFNFFAKESAERILRVRFPGNAPAEGQLRPVLDTYCPDARLISIATVRGGSEQELVYSIVLARDVEGLLQAVRGVNDNYRASVVLGQQELDL